MLCCFKGVDYLLTEMSFEWFPEIDPLHILISLSNGSLIEKSVKSFLQMKGRLIISAIVKHIMMLNKPILCPKGTLGGIQ